MFPCLGGERYWPLTASVGFYRAPPDKVANVVVKWGRHSPWVRFEHDSFDEALRAHAPFGRVAVKFVLSSANGSWTTVLGDDDTFYLATRAFLDLGCEFVGTCWKPDSPYGLPAAEFVHDAESPLPKLGRAGWLRRHLPPELFLVDVREDNALSRRFAQRDQRTVQTSDQVGRWEFHAVGEPRTFEEPEYYERRRKAERLPRELLARYAAAVGVRVDDPDWWDGPVTVVADVNRKPLPHETPPNPEDLWSSMEDLRRLYHYPLDHIPDDLVRFQKPG